MSERDMVRQFHEAMGLPVHRTPTMPSEAERLRRARMLLEEAWEYANACGLTVDVAGVPVADQYCFGVTATHAPDLAAMARESADARYIALGGELEAGIPPEVFAEVHRANMSKLGEDGKPVLRWDGKVMKGPNYRPPDVAGVLARAEHACAWCVNIGNARRTKVLSHVRENPPRSISFLAKRFEVTRQTVGKWLAEAKRRGCIA